MLWRKLVLVALLVTGLVGIDPAAAAPAHESALVGVVQIESGLHHTCALLDTGQVRCWGSNDLAQLGIGTIGGSSDEPLAVKAVTGPRALSGVTQISAGENHTCARLSTGRAVCWGDYRNAQLGNGRDSNDDLRPVPVLAQPPSTPMTGIRQVAAGDTHSCALLTNGQVRCWGFGTGVALGNGPAGGSLNAQVVKGVGGVGTLTGVSGIDAGPTFTCAALQSGGAACWGQNVDGRLGTGDTDDRLVPALVVGVRSGNLGGVAEVTAGASHACARQTSGRAVCWGAIDEGQLGDGTTDPSARPVTVDNPAGDGDLTGVTSIRAGGDHTCAIVTGKQVRCWGRNEDGELGTGDDDQRLLPAATRNVVNSAALANVKGLGVGTATTCAVLTNGQARCWGRNDAGQLGNDSTRPSNLPVVVHLD